MIAPAIFIGTQEGAGRFPAVDLYNLTAPVGGHPEGSTVSANTLLSHGFILPPKEGSS